MSLSHTVLIKGLQKFGDSNTLVEATYANIQHPYLSKNTNVHLINSSFLAAL